MKNKNKVIILASIIVGILVVTLGITYAVITFNETKGNSQLVLGDIWMKYEESNGISLEGVMPGSAYSNYFEFTITGTNTYEKKDIYYDISLVKGDLIAGKTETNRIEDKYLQFKLVEVNGNVETEIFKDQTYEILTNRRIHVATIPKNTANYTKTYRLYMTLSNELIIGNTSDAILSLEEFSNAFASVKVNVTGDFDEKELEKTPTDESCFTTTVNNNEVTITDYDTSCGTDVVIPSTIGGYTVKTIGDSAFSRNNLTSVVIPNSVTTIEGSTFAHNNLTSVVIPNSVTTIGSDAFDANQLTSVVIPNSVTTIGNSAFSRNDLTSVVIPDSVTTIEGSAFAANQLTSVVIPDSVTKISDNAFGSNKLTSVVIPDSVTEIGSSAFEDNDLTSVVIPDSVITIGISAFAANYLTSVVISDSVTKISDYAFNNGYYLEYEGDGNKPSLTSVKIYGKTSTSDFERYGASVFGWEEGYSDDDIEFINE